MYIAIEGIKGTGKSTIIDHLLQTNHRICAFPFTKEIPIANGFEKIYQSNPKYKTNDLFCERLFTERAKWHQQNLQPAEILLGDRSILTSYVTRWNKWGDPYYTIRRSEVLHKGVKHPDVIIWIQSDPERSLERIKERPVKPLGKLDEQKFKLKEAAEIYEELLTDRLYVMKVAKAQIIELPVSTSLADLTNEIQSIINFYKR